MIDGPGVQDSASTQATLIFNPSAGSGDRLSDIGHAARMFREAGWTVDERPTTEAGDATSIAREAAQNGAHMVIVAGGDGTINEAIQGLAHTKTSLGVLPTGSVNVWAREIGLSLNILEAARELIQGDIRQIDLGQSAERVFLLMAGIGFDATVTQAVRPQGKRRLGPLIYLLIAAREALWYRGADVSLQMDEETIVCRSSLIVVSNTRLYGGLVVMSPNASANDGYLDIVVFPWRRIWQAFPRASAILVGQHNFSGAKYYRTTRLMITASTPLAVQLDGEDAGMPELVFTILPRALYVVVPKNGKTKLFDQASERTEAV